jgi:ribonuclease BN (tRNA processing enzyme)
MKLLFLGTGSAFTLNNYQTNFLISTDDNKKRLLIDCGSDVRLALKEQGYYLTDITDVYISHTHADHVGGLEGLAFTTFFNPTISKPNLYLSKVLLNNLWGKSISGGLESIEGSITDINSYFNVHTIDNNKHFVWEKIKFMLVQTIHIMNGFYIIPSFGLFFKVNNKHIFITTDTQFCPNQIMKFYDMADLIIQDCETSPFKSGVHAHYSDLATLPNKVKAKMWLSHYQDGDLPNAQQDGFCGFARKGQVLEL